MIDEATFFKEYAARSGVTEERLIELGGEVFPCTCGEDGCDGWQIKFREFDVSLEPEQDPAEITLYGHPPK
jgi:hypothetical protein